MKEYARIRSLTSGNGFPALPGKLEFHARIRAGNPGETFDSPSGRIK